MDISLRPGILKGMPRRPSLALALALACGPDTASETGQGSTGEPESTTGENGTDGHGTTAPAPTDSPPPPTTREITTTTGDSTTDDSTTGTTAPPAGQCNEIVIADPLLEKYLRQRLDVPEGPIAVELAESLDI